MKYNYQAKFGKVKKNFETKKDARRWLRKKGRQEDITRTKDIKNKYARKGMIIIRRTIGRWA